MGFIFSRKEVDRNPLLLPGKTSVLEGEKAAKYKRLQLRCLGSGFSAGVWKAVGMPVGPVSASQGNVPIFIRNQAVTLDRVWPKARNTDGKKSLPHFGETGQMAMSTVKGIAPERT